MDGGIREEPVCPRGAGDRRPPEVRRSAISGAADLKGAHDRRSEGEAVGFGLGLVLRAGVGVGVLTDNRER
jgi:hypothetical protein